MPSMNHHTLAKTTTDAVLHNFKTGVWNYGEGLGTDFLRTGTPADFPSPDAAFFDSTNNNLAYFEFKPDTESKRGILTGVGQSIAYLRNCNLSYLIAPEFLPGFNLKEYLDDLYTNIIVNNISTGLIIYDNNNPSTVQLVHNVGNLNLNASSTRAAVVDRFWAKHQDLPIPLFHLILHYYYLGRTNQLQGDPFAVMFSSVLCPDSILSTLTPAVVVDTNGDPIKTLTGRKNILHLEKRLNKAASLKGNQREEEIQKLRHHIDTTYTGDNLYNAYRKNYLSFMKGMHMIDSENQLTDLGMSLYQVGLMNGPSSLLFKKYFIKELLTTGHHLDLLLDMDSIKNQMAAGTSPADVLTALEDDYGAKGYLKTNPNRAVGGGSSTGFLKYERILWKALGLTDSNNNVQWKLVTDVCSLPEL